MKCKYCGKDLMDGAKFCVYCGNPIEEVVEQDINAQQDIINSNPISEQKQETTSHQSEIINNTIEKSTEQLQEIRIENQEPKLVEIAKEEKKEDIVPQEIKKENTNNIVVKKNNPILIVIIFFLLVIIIGGGVFVYIKYIATPNNKNTANKTTEETKKEEVTEKDYDKDKAKELVDKYYYVGDSPSKNLFTDEMTSSQKKSIAAKNIAQSKVQIITCEGLDGFTKDATGVCRNNDNSSITTDGKMISYEDLNKEYKYLFGEKEEIEKQDFEVLLTIWKYQSNEDSFIAYNKVGGFISGPYFTTYGVQSAKVNGENLVVNVGYIYAAAETTATIGDEEVTFKEADILKDTFEKEFLDKYLDKLDTYEFTFKYEDDHYIYVDMKKI